MANEFEKAMKILEEVPVGTTLLLHSCCAPCSSACLEILAKKFKVTVFYYNPNIEDAEEYEKRKAEQIRLLQETGWADILDCDQDADAFITMSRGRESCPERGERCYLCYALRIKKTAQTAKKNGFDYFTTTLSVSPYKVTRWINELGYNFEKEFGVTFFPSDFKKKNGYLRSIELSKAYNLYRQDYCGCRFSKAERTRKTGERESK